jgi:Flp pilus assembly protein TadG
MKNYSRQGIMTKIARFLRDPRGISAVEFAFVFPVMVLLYLGGTAVTQGVVLKRKTTLVTRTIGDLVSQYTQIVDTDKTAIFNAATAVILPYAAGQLSVIVSSVKIDASGNATIDWSDSTATTTPHTANAPVTLPAGIAPTDANNLPVAGATVIWAEASYAYTLPVGTSLLGRTSMTLSEQFYLRPRRVVAIKRCATGTCP